MNKKIINILGTSYKILFKSESKEPRLYDNWGFTDFHTKEIYIRDDIEKEGNDTCKNLKDFKNKVLRHEIIHAFLYESGLRENTYKVRSWAENEEMVDWFAIQSPKIFKVYEYLGLLDKTDLDIIKDTINKDKEIERLNNIIEEKDKRIHLALGYMENCSGEPDWHHVYAILDGVDDNYED